MVVLVGGAARKRWWRNVEDGADVTVTVDGRSMPARATLLTDEPARGDAVRAYVERFPRARERLADTDVLVRLSLTTTGCYGPRSAMRPD